MLFLGCTDLVFAQYPEPWSFNDIYGFQPTTIYDLFEDSRGHIWIGTDRGLWEFNGSGFRQYMHPDYDPEYSSIQEDKTGRVWCHNFSAQVFFAAGGELELFGDYVAYSATFPRFLVCEYPEILVQTDQGLLRQNFHTREITWGFLGSDSTIGFSKRKPEPGIVFHAHSLDSYEENPLIRHRNHMWIGTERTMIKPGDAGERWQGVKWTKTGHYFDVNGELWFCVSLVNGVSIYRRWNGESWETMLTLRDKERSPYTAAFFLDDGTGRCYIGSNDGLLTFSKKSGSFVAEDHLLVGKDVNKILEDREGNLLIATLSSGIYVLPRKGSQLTKIEEDVEMNELERLVAVDSTFLYGLTGNGHLIEIAGSGKHYERAKFALIDYAIAYLPETDKIYVNPLPSGYEPRSRQHQQAKYGTERVVGFKDMIGLDEEWTVLSMSSQLSYYNLRNGQRVLIREKRANEVVRGMDARAFYANFSDGLYYYPDSSGKPVMESGSPVFTNAITERPGRGIWALTLDGTLLTVSKGEVVSRDSVGIQADKLIAWKDVVFFKTGKEVVRYDTRNRTKTSLSKADGLAARSVFDIEIWRDTLFISTDVGLYAVPTSDTGKNEVAPRIQITGLRILGRDTTLLPEYQLKYNENFLKISFSAIAIRSQKTFTYKYRMKGLSENWSEVEAASNTAEYSGLAPGKYTFEVVGVNEDGVESTTPAALTFVITAPFWKKAWFYVLCALVLIGGTALIFLIRNRQMLAAQKKAEEERMLKQQLVGSQLVALRSQMNPHFLFNALNSIQDFIISNQRELAGNYLSMFANLMRTYLAHSKVETLTLEEEIQALELYLKLERVRFEETLEYEVRVDEDLDTSSIEIPSLLVQPFVENAIKHGLLHKRGNRVLLVSFENDGDAVRCIVEDNGVGRKKAAEINARKQKKHDSHAVSAIQQRIELLNQGSRCPIEIHYEDLLDEKKAAIGTRVTVNFCQ